MADEVNDTLLTLQILQDEAELWRIDLSDEPRIPSEPAATAWRQCERLKNLEEINKRSHKTLSSSLHDLTDIDALHEAIEAISGLLIRAISQILKSTCTSDITLTQMYDLLQQLGVQELTNIGEILPAIGKVYIENPPISSCPVFAPDNTVFFVDPHKGWSFTENLDSTYWKYTEEHVR